MSGAHASGAAGPVAILIGPMGAGKSTVGASLGALLSVDLVDSDAEIERRTGRTIPEIFEGGEQSFRAIEEDVVARQLSRPGIVLSLGGGAVLSERTRARLAGQPVVYLTVDPDSGFARVAGSDRPLLRTEDPRARYAELLAARDDAYREAAAVIVDTAGRHPDDLAAEIVSALKAYAQQTPT